MRIEAEFDNPLWVYLRPKFPRDVKRRAYDECNCTCQECGTRVRIKNGGKGEQNIQPHHRLCESLGGNDARANLVLLCSDEINGCHRKWDRLTLDSGIVHPGIPIDEVPVELIGNRGLYRKALHRFGKNRNG